MTFNDNKPTEGASKIPGYVITILQFDSFQSAQLKWNRFYVLNIIAIVTINGQFEPV